MKVSCSEIRHCAKHQNVSGNGRTTHTDKQTPDQTTRPRHKKKIKKAPHRKKFLSRLTASTFAFPTRKPTLQKAKDLAFPTVYFGDMGPRFSEHAGPAISEDTGPLSKC